MMFRRSKEAGVPLTAIFPPNICGPGKIPLDLKGGRDIALHRGYAKGAAAPLPEGINTLISPCDASDVAQGFRLAVARRDAAAGEIFNVGPARALTFPRLVEAFSQAYGVTIPIEWVTPQKFYGEIVTDRGAAFHFLHHMCPDISKARERLGYRPEFTCEQTIGRAVAWMRESKVL